MIKNIIYTFVVLNTILASNFVLSNKSENASKFSFDLELLKCEVSKNLQKNAILNK